MGVPSLSKALTLALASQICPVLYHAGMVLLNSLLDTVPGEWCWWGWGLWALPWSRSGGGRGAVEEPGCWLLGSRVGAFQALRWKSPGFKCSLCC